MNELKTGVPVKSRDSIEEGKKKPLFERRWLVQAVMGLGFMTILEGCGLSEKEIEQMQVTEIHDLVQNPDRHMTRAVKVIGFIGEVSSRVEKHERDVRKDIRDTKGNIVGHKNVHYYIKRSIDEYSISNTLEDKSESFPVVITDERESKFESTPAPELPKMNFQARYQLVGSVTVMRDVNGNARYVLEASKYNDNYRVLSKSLPETDLPKSAEK